MSALLAVQTAIYGLLAGDSALLALAPGGVHDHVPQGTAKPYVVLGSKTEIPENTHSDFGKEVTVTVDIWSEEEGNREALLILARMDELLDGQVLYVDGWDAWWVQNEFVATLRENDGDRVLRHVVPRYRISLQEL